MSFSPMIIAISIGKNNHTTKGIIENGTFSINVPSEDLVIQTDYCGITSGAKVDKSKIFTVFYGELGSAPMIDECKLTMECKVVDKKDRDTIVSFFGEVVKTYADKDIITENRYNSKKAPNLVKLRPMIGAGQKQYHKLGESIAEMYSIGKEYEKKVQDKK
jgi:flavin reductase (DIM6/NTAB) family NADH-FMN oxidoreductase RutF